MRTITILIVVFTLVTLIGCKDDTITPQGNTPSYVLELVGESFNRRGISVLDGVLSTDFVFYFDPNDVGNDVEGFIIPVSWGRDSHMEACGNMFDNAYSIDFNIVTNGIEDPKEATTTFETNDVQIDIRVMVDSVNGFRAKGVCDFEFTNDTSAGYDDWKVSTWYDRTSRPSSVGLLSNESPATLGSILAGFYE
jgi:hypothetical protein